MLKGITISVFICLLLACTRSSVQDSSNTSSTDSTESADTSETNDFTAPDGLFSLYSLTDDISVIPPVDKDKFTVASQFGPRIMTSDSSRDDFHRGIDISGDEGNSVYAIADGEIYAAYEEGSSSYPNGGNVVITKHDLKNSFSFNGTTVTKIYAVYMHLNSLGTAAKNYLTSGTQDKVSQKDILGTLGSTGSASYDHLHFEIRLQTTCSYKYQLNNPDSSCAALQFDPHINPMALYLDEQSSDNYQTSLSNSEDEVTVKITSIPGSLNVDGIIFKAFDSDGSKLFSDWTSFNVRKNFDASSEDKLDDFKSGTFKFTPYHFNTSSEEYKLEVALEKTNFKNAKTVEATLFTTQGSIETTSLTL